MAPPPVFFFLLWVLCLFRHGAASFYKVTCSTDYTKLINCSCSASVPKNPLLINVTCSAQDDHFSGSCVIRPLHSWCQILDEALDDVGSIETTCTTTVSEEGNQLMNESSNWQLSRVVKPQPPSDVQVENTSEFYNITWNHTKKKPSLTYKVRIRARETLLKGQDYCLPTNDKYIVIDLKKLQPSTDYIVDVQAKFSPEYHLQGPWSEWSSPVEWRIPGGPDVEGPWWKVFLPVIIVIIFGLLLCYSQKTCWQRKIELITYIPKPDDFFKPLYHNYEGNFKEWVKPVFSEYDYLRITSNVQMAGEKQHDILHWSNEKQRDGKDSETKQDGHIAHMLQAQSNPLLQFQDGDSSQGTSHSTGHISILTVTISGEEFEEEVTSQSSLRSFQDGESLGSFEGDNREHANYALEEPHMSRMDRQNRASLQQEDQIAHDLLVQNINFQLHAQFNEPERVSLDSFEQSEDGYPHVDLDTIDSGFGECSSPGASTTAGQMNSDLFQEHKNSNSNYVKQWMICSTIKEDSSILENELPESQ